MNHKHRAGRIVLEVLSMIFAAVFLLPVIWSLAASLKTEGTPIVKAWDWFLPPYTLENYPRILFDSSVPRWTLNSFLVSIICTAAVLLLSSMAAFAIAKLKFRGAGVIYLYFLLGLMVPGEATIVPLFITVNGMELIDSYMGLIFPQIAGSMNLIIMVTFFRGVPDALIEAAKIDGAGSVTIFSRILLPLSKTVMVTVGIFSFIGSWNNYLWPLLCAMSEEMFTLPVGIPSFVGTYTIDYVLPLTANMVASLPAIVLFLVFERYIVEGVALSGVKG